MKRTVSVKATDDHGTTVELVGKIDTGRDGFLTRNEVERVADDLRDQLMLLMPEVRYTAFPLSKVSAS